MHTIYYKILNYVESLLKISKNRYKIHQKSAKVINVPIIKILNYKESLLIISKNRYKLQQKFAKVSNVPIIAQETYIFSIIYNKIQEKSIQKS